MKRHEVDDLQACQVGYIAATRNISGNNDPHGAVTAASTQLALAVCIRNNVLLIAERRVNFSQGKQSTVAVTAGSNHAEVQQVVLDRRIGQQPGILDQIP